MTRHDMTSHDMRSRQAPRPPARTIERKAEPKQTEKTEPKTDEKPEPKVELVLGMLRCAILRIDMARQELLSAGVALKAGYVTPQDALDWAEEIVPGWLGYVPPRSGLVIKRNGGTE